MSERQIKIARREPKHIAKILRYSLIKALFKLQSVHTQPLYLNASIALVIIR